MGVEKVRRPDSLTALVFKEIEKFILSGELCPGEPVNEKGLAERLSVSRGPVREACRRLEQAGLVECIANRGSFVRKLNAKEAAELCDLRAALAGFSGRTLAQKITEHQLSHLLRIHKKMEYAAADDDADEFYNLNSEFHDAIFYFAGNDRLKAIYDSLGKELFLFRWRAMHSDRNFQTSLQEHKVILDALADRDAARAGETLEQHSITVKIRLLGYGISSA